MPVLVFLMLASVTPWLRLASVVPAATTRANANEGELPAGLACRASVMICSASLPSSLSALRPVATPVAFVMNGLTAGFSLANDEPAWMTPTMLPESAWNWNASPLCRLLTRTHGVDDFGDAGSVPSAERQP